jgi:hypothetical protein
MPIKIFESINTFDLEKQANEFMADKNVLHTQFTSLPGDAINKATKYQVLVQYEDKK